MAPKYRLVYFNLRARGEPIRWIFHYAGKEFEDKRIEFDQWPGVKPTTPFGTLPYLEVDGKQLGGSIPIARYLGRQFGLAGHDSFEEAQADALVDYVADAGKDYTTWIAAFFAKDMKRADAIKEKYFSEGVIPYLQTLERMLMDNHNGENFMIGKKVTWADFVLVAFLDELKFLNADVLDNYPRLRAYTDRVHQLEGIQEWLAARPSSVV